MTIAEEGPIFQRPKPKKVPTEGKAGLVKRAAYGTVAAVGIATGVVGGMEAAGVGIIGGGESPNPGHTQTMPEGMPSATAMASNIVDISPTPKVDPTTNPTVQSTISPTPEATPTSTPNPDKPVFTYWTEAQINQALQEAANNGKILIVDTWSANGGGEEELIASSSKTKGFAIKGIDSNVFDSPIFGVIENTGIGSSSGRKFVNVRIREGINLYFSFDGTAELQIKKDQMITLGMPLAKNVGETDITAFANLTHGNILVDQAGQRVQPPDDK